MLIHLNFFIIGLVVLFLILALHEDNMVHAILAMVLGGISTLFWAGGWEIPRAEFVVENAAAENVENMGTWVTHYQNFTTPAVTAWIPALLSLVSFIVFVYLVLENFRGAAQ